MNAGGNWGKGVSSPTRPNSPGWKTVNKIPFLVQINSNDSSPRGCHQFPLVISCSCFVTKICQGLGKESLVNIHDLAITMRSWIVGNAMIWCELSAAFSYRCSKWTGFPFQWISWFLLPRQRESCPHGNWALMLLETTLTTKLVGSFLTLRVSFHVSPGFFSKLWQTRVSHIERFYFLFTTYWFHSMIHRSPNIYSGSPHSTLMIKIGVNMTYTNRHSQ